MPYKNILLIDDDEEDQEIFKTVVKSINTRFNCTAIGDAEEALLKLNAGEVLADIIFTDLRMPGMTGRDFLQAVKLQEALKEIPVIVLSDTSDEQTIQETKQLGACAFIPKPNTFSALKKYLLFIAD